MSDLERPDPGSSQNDRRREETESLAGDRVDADCGETPHGPAVAKEAARGEVLAELMALPNAVPIDAAKDLHRLIGADLARSSPEERRNEKLGLLAEMVKGTGELPTRDSYDKKRKAAIEARASDSAGDPQGGDPESGKSKTGKSETGHPEGEGQADTSDLEASAWPTSTSLVDSYRSWLGAVDAACRIAFGRELRGIGDSYRHANGHQRSYEKHEVITALIKAHRELGLPDHAWPRQTEYDEWARLSRAVLRNSRKQPRIPGPKQIRDLYGSWSKAIDAAKAHVRKCKRSAA